MPTSLNKILNEIEYPDCDGLALLRLLVLSQEEAPENARRLLAQEATEQEFERRLDLVCRGEKSFALPNLSLEAIREMLDITQVRVQDTQFYKDVFEKGQGQGQGESEG